VPSSSSSSDGTYAAAAADDDVGVSAYSDRSSLSWLLLLEDGSRRDDAMYRPLEASTGV
jgi:hypothetical protein